MKLLVSNTLTNQNISSALLTHTYTADADRSIYFRLFADQVVGNGYYTAYITIQRGGAGSAYRAVPITTANVASGVTSIALTTGSIPVSAGDVLRVYLQGLAGDTTTPDIITEVHEDNSTLDTVWTPAKAGYLTGDAFDRLGVPAGASVSADIATRLAAAGYTAPDNASITAIKAKTDGLPAFPASSGDVTTAEANIIAALPAEPDNAGITAIKSKTDGLPALPASFGDVTTAEANIIAALPAAPDNLSIAAIKAKTDGLPALPASSGDVTTAEANIIAALPVAPDNASIAAIKAKTDGLPADPADESNVLAAISAIVLNPTIALAVSETDALAVSSGEISITSYAQLSQSITSSVTSNLDTAQKIWFALKDHYLEDDSKSLLMIEKTGGLSVAAKDTYATTTDGSLQVTGVSGAWEIFISIKAAATALLHGCAGGEKLAEVKALLADDSIVVIWSGTGVVSQGVIHTIS
ncbi:MAG: hypothetical protein IPL32_18145 [Chloracidobacterium sp.]|nr:hypothetical protein [Chloracidobacterium sp.]